MLFNLMTHWNLLGKVRAKTTNNASDMRSAMAKLTDMLNVRNDTSPVENLNLCVPRTIIAHVVNLSVKYCLSEEHVQVYQIRSLLSAMRSSLKKTDIYESTQRQLGLSMSLPSLDVPLRFSATFSLIRNACKLYIYKARPILNSLTNKVHNLPSFTINHDVWKKSEVICNFLEMTASTTES